MRFRQQVPTIIFTLCCACVAVLSGCQAAAEHTDAETVSEDAVVADVELDTAEQEEIAAREAEITAREAEIEALEADLETRKLELAAQQEEAARQKQAAIEKQAAQQEERIEQEPVEEVVVPRYVSVTVPAQTVFVVEMNQSLSSHTSQSGQGFWATVTQEVTVNGRVAVPRGTMVAGRVTEAHAANKIGGRAKLALRFDRLDLPGGTSVPITATFAEAGKSQRGKDAAMIGGGVVGGAILGEAIDEGEGTKIGAIVGGLAGALAAKKTKGKPVEVPTGTVLSLTLTQGITVQVQE